MNSDPVCLVASGDSRLDANLKCWATQERTEAAVASAIQSLGYQVERAHPVDPRKGHGFIDSQKYGMEVFKSIPPQSPVVVVEAVWQYSHHVLAGLYSHPGPILTVANWSGQWPGLVGLLNLNGSLTKAGVRYETLWSVDFQDAFFRDGLARWLRGQAVGHDASHVHPLRGARLPPDALAVGREVARELLANKAILGVFDEGCMGMYNAIIPDELLHRTGVFKERLSQASLYAEMQRVNPAEAQAVKQWLDQRGVQFNTGPDPAVDLQDDQILDQCRMYIAALRIADRFGCDAIGIQYQLGLTELTAASDLAEGLLNNVDRPPVFARDGRELYPGRAVPHFNEVDECSGLDALITNRVWTRLALDPETTLHDIRYGEEYQGEFVWVFEISGAAPPQHFIGGYAGASSDRQPSMYFPNGGGSLKGISKAGEIVWSRVYVADGVLKADIGRAAARELPRAETERRWAITTPQWPIMHAVTYGVSRNQMMARHKANHIQVAYAPDAAQANTALAAKAAAFHELGLETFICGTRNGLVQ